MVSFGPLENAENPEGSFSEDPVDPARRARSDALLLSLARVLRQVSEPGSPDAVFHQILEDAIDITYSEFGYLGEVLRDGSGEPYLRVLEAKDVTGLEHRAEFFADVSTNGLSLRSQNTPVGEAILTEEPSRVGEGLSDESVAGLPRGHPRAETFLAVPLHHAGSLVGVLALANRPEGYDAELLEDIEPLCMTMASLLRSRVAERSLSHRQATLERVNLELQAKNDEIRRMYHTLCHELKTPLTSVREFASLVRDGVAGPLTAEQIDYLDEALLACDHLTRHVNDLVDITRMETGKLGCRREPGDVGSIVQHCVHGYVAEAGAREIRLLCEVRDGLPRAEIDETRIGQVMANLLSNALKFTSAGGSVRVTVGPWSLDPEWIEVVVTDTGRGIEAKQLARIFDRLYQVSESDWSTQGGLGLGLHISREIVRMHGGRISAESAPGHGTRFAFTLPGEGVLVAE